MISKRQEALWKVNNKNELVICVSLNKTNEVQWAEVFSWTKHEDLKVSVRDYIQAQKKLDLVAGLPRRSNPSGSDASSESSPA